VVSAATITTRNAAYATAALDSAVAITSTDQADLIRREVQHAGSIKISLGLRGRLVRFDIGRHASSPIWAPRNRPTP
jgi:hypothetical protein